MADYESILNYAEKYNMPLDTALNVDWWQKMADKAYQQGRADAIEKAVKFFSEHAHEVYDHVSARDFICDNLEMLKEQK